MSRKILFTGGSGVSILTPSQIFGANYFDHWRAEDLSSVGDGNTFSNWLSVGLNGGNFQAVSAGTEALYIADYNSTGFSCVETVGANSRYFVNNSRPTYKFLSDGTGATIIYVARHSGSTAFSVMLANSSGSTNTGILAGFRDNGSFPDSQSLTVTRGVAGSPAVQNIPTNIQAPNQIFLSMMSIVDNVVAADRSKIWINQTPTPLQANVETNSFDTGNPDFDLHLFCRPSGSLRWDGQVFEIIVADTDITQQQAIDLQAWFNNKYGTFPI